MSKKSTNREPLTDEEGEVRELTAEDFKHFRPTSEVLPPELYEALTKPGRPKKAKPKVSTTIRLDQEVLDFFRKSGKGWQTRINDLLKEHVAEKTQA